MTRNSPVTVLIVVTFAMFMDYYLYGMVSPMTQASPIGSIGEASMGVLLAAYALGLIVATPILGVMTDRIGRKRPMIWGVMAQMLSVMLFCYGTEFNHLVVARLLQGAAAGCTWTAGMALIAEHFDHDRVRAMGIALAGSTMGSVFGPIVSAFLYEQDKCYMAPFMFAGILLLVDALMRVFLLPKHAAQLESNADVLLIIKNKSVLAAAFAVALAGASWSILEPIFPAIANQRFGAGPGAIGFAWTASTIVYGVCAPIVAWVTDTFGVRKTICAGLVATAVVLPLLIFASTLTFSIVVLCLASMAFAFTLNPTSAELGDAVDRLGLKCYAVVYAIYNIAYSLGMIASDVMVATSEGTLSNLQIMLIMSTLFLMCVPLFLKKEKPHASVV